MLTADPTPELRIQSTQLVFGDGTPDANIVFVGEAPGKQEDLQGLPFVGASGKMLNSLLESVGLKRDDVYITNIVKYRPPENRDPTTDEKNAMWPYLLRQIAIIQPSVVITLGRHSGQAFKKDLRIGADHGVIAEIHAIIDGNDLSITLLPLYHPAAALYNGSLRQTLIDDFAAVAHYI